MKIISIIGARPQFVKVAVVSRAIEILWSSVTHAILHTGQHFDANMSEVFFKELGIPHPDYALGINGGTHGENTGRMLESIESVLIAEKPNYVLIYGDTDTTLAGALAAAKLHIPVAHVEAGLRSFNRRMPEEINRIVSDHVSTLHFTPTDTATKNLRSEGISPDKIVQVGDVMFDAALYYRSYAKQPKGIHLESVFFLATLHRADNTDNINCLAEIISGLNELAADTQIILPLHPRTRARLADSSLLVNNITIVEPIGYLEMLWMLDRCQVVITDSGGVQKEAYFFRKPCVTTRNETEWTELVQAGVNVLVGADRRRLIDAVRNLSYPSSIPELYGDGNAGLRIIETLKLTSV